MSRSRQAKATVFSVNRVTERINRTCLLWRKQILKLVLAYHYFIKTNSKFSLFSLYFLDHNYNDLICRGNVSLWGVWLRHQLQYNTIESLLSCSDIGRDVDRSFWKITSSFEFQVPDQIERELRSKQRNSENNTTLGLGVEESESHFWKSIA